MARSESEAKKSEGGVWETVKTIFWALLIAAAFRSLLFQPFSIPSGSMKPTLFIGDYLFVTKYAYGYSNYSFPFAPDLFTGRIWSDEPERGDVVVFKHPRHDACTEGPVETVVNFVGAVFLGTGGGPQDCVDYVKRIVGLPGDTVQVKAGILHVNGRALPTERIEDFVETRSPAGSPPSMPRCTNDGPRGGPCVKEQYLETFPERGLTHAILNVEGPMGDDGAPQRAGHDNTRLFTVPEGHFFFMGDNRDNSIDSRFPSVGFVPFENLIGRADVVAISSDGPFWQVWQWRFDRFLKSIE